MADVSLFISKVTAKEAVVGVIGLGYVGLPLALSFAEKSFKVIGFDISERTVNTIMSGHSLIKHIPAERVAKAVNSGTFKATSDFSLAKEADALIICVPTPLTHQREPDVSYIVGSAESIAPHIHKDQLIVLESTTYPGTTREVVVPILEKKSGLKLDRDFWAAFSPEREDPNNGQFCTTTIPKVVGGVTASSLKVAKALYDEIIIRTVPVSSAEAAESAKLLENIFRCINIAMVNELKVLFQRMNIDIWEVIAAASTKPFGFMPFYPGPGLGGHCIPIDPFYLTWKAREFGLSTRFIELAGEINTAMPDYVIARSMDALNDQGKALKGAKVLILGLAYKKNVDDYRESPTFVIWTKLLEKGAKVRYADSFIPEVGKTREYAHFAGEKSESLENIGQYDLVIIATAHDGIDYAELAQKAQLVVDTRGVCPKLDNVYKA